MRGGLRASVRPRRLGALLRSKVLRPVVSALAFVALLAASSTAAAEGAKKRTSTLGWDRLPGADACVATQPLARAVEARLGRKVFVSPAEADVSVEGRVGKKGGAFVATIVLRDAEGKLLGTRTLEKADPSCNALTDALVLVIAVMIDPDAATSPVPPPPPDPPPPAPPPAPVTRVEKVYVPVPVPVQVQKPEDPRWCGKLDCVFEADLSARLTVGTVPSPGIGVSGSGMIALRGIIGFVGRASYVLPRSAPVLGADVAISHATLGGGICPLAHSFGRLFLTGCGEGELGLLVVVPKGLPRTVDETRFTAAFGLGGAASVRLARFLTLRLAVSGLVPLVRESFVATLPDRTTTEVFRQLPVTFATELGLGMRFP